MDPIIKEILCQRRIATAWIKRAGLALVVVALASVTLAACGSSSGSTTTTITLYNGQHVQTTDALVTAFEKEYPNISVAVVATTRTPW